MVLDNLESRQPAAGHADLGDAAAFDAAPVGDPDIATDRDGRRVFEKRQHRPAQRVRFEHGVGIDHQDQRARRGVDAGVGCIGLAASAVLVDDHELGLEDRSIHAPERRGLHRLFEGQRRGHELKRLLQERQRAVRRPVVDDDDLARLIVEREQRADTLDDRQRLIAGGHDDRDERQRGKVRDERPVPRGPPPLISPHEPGRRAAHRELRRVPQHEVRGDDERERGDGRHQAH